MIWLPPSAAQAFAGEETTAYRIASANGGWIERFGETALISLKHPGEQNALLRELDAWAAEAGISLPRVYLRHLVRQPREKDIPILLRGGSPAQNFVARATKFCAGEEAGLGGAGSEVVRENGLRYEVHFTTGYSCGLFCDQRANRKYLRSLSPARVLNAFAYTCAFSVAAAVAGAETLSVDLSKSSLARGRRNFELNGLDPARHRFLADDVLDVLPRLERRGEKFDAIILDPPTFGRSGPKRAFRAERDYEELIVLALACATKEASILLSTNCSSLDAVALRKMASRATRGRAEFHQEPEQPDIPACHAASAVWMRLGKKNHRRDAEAQRKNFSF